MTSLRIQDRALLTATELALIESSAPSRIRAYTFAQLNNRIVRVRRFWDKYRELARQQQRTTKTSRQQGRLQPALNVRTERKAQVFAGALDRFEKRLEQLTREARRRPRPPATPVPKSLRGPIAQRDTVRRKTQQGRASNEAAQAPRITRQFQKSKMRAIQGHLSARGKRRQATRDAR
ncbi:MAG: hypothetical protein OEV99_01445 [Nitrospira sp.]|nr:hypothetical protein [Nitrospira sp.]MDH4368479.1 hypothetical protein [Nitrospira sp.]MDH5346361.1 hypothetical protein [Nitrospira sp.]MDH5496129.1 hypothetical protein [Nitrospira sp.]MDH5725461.1 hypothetical protein [Nitrospira sp.]